MKKLLLSLLTLPLLLLGMSQAISIEGFTTAIDQATANKGSTSNQISFLKTLQTLLQSPNFTTSPYAQIFAELERYAGEKINKLQTKATTPTVKKSDWTNYISIVNVDSARVRDILLMWHNQERQSRGISSYQYHSDLEKSAQTRADTLNREWRTSNTHIRNAGDGYYNYNSITDWFGALGIRFPSAGGGRAAFSESVGRGYYNCKSTDCTESLITAVKTTRDFFMSEKSSNGSHYKAITMSHFTQMGIGISIDVEKKRYYLTIHYGMDIVGD